MKNELINNLLKSMDLESRLKVDNEFAFIELITLLGYREEKFWTEEEDEILGKLMKFAEVIAKRQVKTIKEWEKDGRPKKEKKMRELYTLEELKSLNVGDEVYIEYKHYEHGNVKHKTKVESIDETEVFFEDGYDFPFDSENGSVETEFAVQDDGDYTFKVFKI